jgi:CDGSH-type Zn-finger protein
MGENEGRKPSIRATTNGPYLVIGELELANSKGEELELDPVETYLCRCGGSKNKPYCDGTHLRKGFRGQKENDGSKNRTRDYEGNSLTIHDNRWICAHAEICTSELPTVFDREARPWIDPDGDTAEDCMRTIDRCPSGALSYTVDGRLHRDHEVDPAVRVSHDGPYNVVGGPEFSGQDVTPETAPVSKEHYSLCRCGASKNKPFCDGSHAEAGFKDEKN